MMHICYLSFTAVKMTPKSLQESTMSRFFFLAFGDLVAVEMQSLLAQEYFYPSLTYAV